VSLFGFKTVLALVLRPYAGRARFLPKSCSFSVGMTECGQSLLRLLVSAMHSRFEPESWRMNNDV